ncbi:MAG TPA: cation:proton antiporter [Vicingus sp.]|nr:cation:proton antiporter [Vicingus sp.]
MEIPLLKDIVIILGLSVLIILLFQRLKLPEILGFLITGVVAGPNGLNLINASHEVELLSEIGIIFLLFVIGIEFSLKGLVSIKNTVIWGGLMQVGGTIALTFFGAYYFFDLTYQTSIFLGFLLALSSTAIVLKMLQEKGEITSPHGRVTVAILIFQDIIVVLMMLLTPLLANQSESPLMELGILFLKLAAILVVLFALGKYAIPNLFRLVVKSKSRELFILTTVVICFATAWMTSVVELSLALGAFFAGLIISESDYSHQATANILPFREIFISFFFVSVGMLLDLNFFIQHIFSIHILAIVVILLKIIVVIATVIILRYPSRTVLITSLSLFQVGEFAFLLSAKGMEYKLLSDNIYQHFLAISIISMGATPFIIKYASPITDYFLRIPIPAKVRYRLREITKNRAKNSTIEETSYHDHIVIIGYGLNGENVAKAAKTANIPYLIVDLDAEAVKKGQLQNEPMIYGDAADETILKHVHVHEARVVVVAISSPETTKKIVKSVREYSKTTYIIVRTRYVSEIEGNLKLGADEVIPEEFETSIEIFTRVLKKYLVPQDEIQMFINNIRSDNYDMLRSMDSFDKSNIQLSLPNMEIATLSVQQGNNQIVGKTIKESNFRNKFGVTVLAIKRDNRYISEITPDTIIKQDDVLYIFGSPDNIIKVNSFLKFIK